MNKFLNKFSILFSNTSIICGSQKFPNPEYKAEINWLKKACREIGVPLDE